MQRRFKKAGYIRITGPEHRDYESDTATCNHCNKIFIVRSNNPQVKAEVGDLCRMCMKVICPKCAVSGKPCVTFAKRLDAYEKKQKLFKDMEL